MSSVDLALPGRVLAVGAHPDDVEFGCGATLAKWAVAGAHCELLVLTDGSKGTWDADADIAHLVATREEEQRAAARKLGIARVHFGGYVDGELDDGTDERRRVCEIVRAARPDVVLGHDPWKQYRLHPDHRAAGQLLIDGIVTARDPHFFPDAGPHHRPAHLLLFEAQVVDHAESVDDRAVDAKIDALLCHRSQWRSTMGIDADAPDAEERRRAFAERIRAEVLQNGSGVGVAAAETFKRIDEL